MISIKAMSLTIFENFLWSISFISKVMVDTTIYYQPEVRRGKYWGLGVFLLQYFPLVKI